MEMLKTLTRGKKLPPCERRVHASDRETPRLHPTLSAGLSRGETAMLSMRWPSVRDHRPRQTAPYANVRAIPVYRMIVIRWSKSGVNASWFPARTAA